MSRSLPYYPSLENLKKQAKDLLAAHRRGDGEACKVLRNLHRFCNAADGEILEADLSLHDAQFALAMEYGFESWAALKRQVHDIRQSEHEQWAEGQGLWLAGVKSFPNDDSQLSHMRAVRCVLQYHGAEIDWNWLLGACGEAFCYYYHPDGTFLSQHVHSWDVGAAALAAYGCEGRWHAVRGADVSETLGLIESEIRAGRPVISPGIAPTPDGVHSRCNYWYVVSGIDLEARKVALAGAGDRVRRTPLPHGDDPNPEGPHPRWFGICRTFDGMGGHYGPPGADNPVLLVRPGAGAPDELTVARRALARAVGLGRETSVTATYGWGAGTYLSGLAAMRRLRDDLDTAPGDGIEEFARLYPAKGDPFHGLSDELAFMDLLAQRRRVAAGFCTQLAAKAPAARKSLSAAADRYGIVAERAQQVFEVRYGRDEAARARIQEMIDTGRSGRGPEWEDYWRNADAALASRANRRRMAQLVAEALEHETAALKEIEAAVGLLD
ncbi:MAG TPA: hypothetical protein VNA25_24855 [Phycisphaerae bacterium]|nr:hypothetical protein [Phycisphaerae bacterium]